MSEIFDRTKILIGQAGWQKLQNCRVAVFGLGGVGSYTADALARAGIGYLFLVDHDLVDVTNINRQLHALTSTVGQSKVKLMARRIKDINPDVVVETKQQKFTPDLADSMLDCRQLNFVVDAIDDVNNKAALIAACVNKKIPLVAAMGAGNTLDATQFKIDSIWKTTNCPLARVMRKKLKTAGITADVPVVYSTAPRVNSQAGLGSISFVPPVAGLLLASFVVQSLLDLNMLEVTDRS